MPASRLTQLQRDVLQRFFAMEQRFFLTGGAALVGFHLRHRDTDDLDLFTSTQAAVLEEGRRALERVAQELGGTLTAIDDSREYKRLVLRRGSEELKVDLAYDPHQFRPKVQLDGITIDSAEEITINKLTTLLSRSEIRDLVDLMKLEEAGHKLEEALPLAAEKDLGLTAGRLLEVLSEIRIGEDAPIPGGVPAAQLRRYLDDLVHRLARMAFPQ